MKKIIMIVVCCMFSILNVKALENDTSVRYEYIENIYSNRQVGEHFYTGPQGFIYANEKIAYCLDPTVILKKDIYSSSTDFSIQNISAEKLKYLELISYFGYGYENRTDFRYYLATQELIWESIIESNIYWTRGKGGEILNVDLYKEEIIKSIENYKKTPNIPTYIETYQNEELILKDENDVLKYYQVNLSSTVIEDNKLKLSTKIKGTITVSLTRKPLLNRASYIYVSEGSQTVATFGYTNNNTDTINITYKVKNRSKIKITKRDSDTQERIKNKNIKIKIYDVTRKKYIKENNSEIITIGEDGIYESTSFLEAGEYTIEEIEAPLGYKKLKEPMSFNIYEYDGSLKGIVMYNEPIHYNIKINKTGEVFKGIEEKDGIIKGVYNIEPLDNIVYGLYSNDEYYDKVNNKTYYKDDLIMEIKINNGHGISQPIKYGNYYLKEIKYPESYESSEIINIEFNNENDTITYNFINKLKKGNIIIQKLNDEIPLQGAEIKINNKILISDKEGYIKIHNIPYNEYNLEEIKAPMGYQLDNEIKILKLASPELIYKFNNKPIEPTKEEIKPDPLPDIEKPDLDLEENIIEEDIKNIEEILPSIVENPNTSISKTSILYYIFIIVAFIILKIKT